MSGGIAAVHSAGPAAGVAATPAGDLTQAAIQKLTNLNDINRLLHETIAKERSIEHELDQKLSKRSVLERDILTLNATTSETLQLVCADSEQLLASVQSTASLAERISAKVRALDRAQSNVQDVLNVIGLILDRSNCIHGVQTAMDGGDYESAAGYIESFLDLERRLSPAAQMLDSGQVEEQRQLLMSAKSRLEALAAQRIEEASAARDRAAVVRFCRLYRPLGSPQDGLTKYLAFLQLAAGTKARASYSAASELLDAGKAVDWVGTLTALFRDLAVSVEEDETTIRDAFGAAAVMEAVWAVQAECDTQGTRLLQRYNEAKRVGRMVKEARGRKRPGAAGTAEGGLDPRQVEPLVQELALLCQRCEEFATFMLSKAREAAADALPPAREAAFKGGAFAVAVRELVGNYMALEEFYLESTTAMAMRIDEAVPGTLTSSMVDDVFFIAKKSSMRCLSTGSVQCVCALLGEVNNVLANDYRAALQAKLSGGASRLLSGSTASSSSDGTAAAVSGSQEHAVAINNADVSSDYVTKLKVELEGYVSRVFTDPGQCERIRSVLSDLAKTANDFRQLTTRALETVADAVIPRLRVVLDELGQVSYQMREADYSDSPQEDTWVGALIAALDGQLRPLQLLLTPGAWEGLFHASLDKLLGRLEVIIGRKPFTQLGGLQLDKDVRALVVAFGEMTTRTVRDKFARLSQMGIVLSLESVEEFLDYWGDDTGHITWRLTPTEVRAILAQRTDFSKDAIAALAL